MSAETESLDQRVVEYWIRRFNEWISMRCPSEAQCEGHAVVGVLLQAWQARVTCQELKQTNAQQADHLQQMGQTLAGIRQALEEALDGASGQDPIGLEEMAHLAVRAAERIRAGADNAAGMGGRCPAMMPSVSLHHFYGCILLAGHQGMHRDSDGIEWIGADRNASTLADESGCHAKELADLHARLEYAERVAQSWRTEAKAKIEPAAFERAASVAEEIAKKYGAGQLGLQISEAIRGLIPRVSTEVATS
jgi:hypothetical protein